MGSKNGLSGKKIGQPESNFGGIFEGDFGTLRHRIFRWRVWHNLTKSEQLNTILMQALSNKLGAFFVSEIPALERAVTL